MVIDAATRRNLELMETLGGARDGSLIATLDRTITGPGARLLAARLSAPLTDPAAIHERLDSVGFFLADQPLPRSAEHTSELQSLMRFPYAVYCLNKKNALPHPNIQA